MSVYIRNAFI